MRILRISLLIALVLAMLPLGAYLTQRMEGPASVTVAAQADFQKTTTALPFKPVKKCRTTLPGTPCHQDVGVLPTGSNRADTGSRHAPSSDVPALVSGPAPSAIFHPPRSL
jgi:hypothetical protein